MRILSSFAWAVLAGCSVSPAPLITIPEGHPASADSREAAYEPPPNPFKGDPEAAAASKEEHAHEHAQPEKKEYPLDVCVVSGEKLGSMGKPVVLKHDGREVRLCCPGCIDTFKAEPAKYLKKLDEAEKKKHELPGDRR